MARKSSGTTSGKTVTTLKHEEAKRKNIPTAEFQSVLISARDMHRKERLIYDRED